MTSSNETERHAAADKLFAANQRKEWHSDDWGKKKNDKRVAPPKMTQTMSQAATLRRTRERAEADVEKLKEQGRDRGAGSCGVVASGR